MIILQWTMVSHPSMTLDHYLQGRWHVIKVFKGRWYGMDGFKGQSCVFCGNVDLLSSSSVEDGLSSINDIGSISSGDDGIASKSSRDMVCHHSSGGNGMSSMSSGPNGMSSKSPGDDGMSSTGTIFPFNSSIF